MDVCLICISIRYKGGLGACSPRKIRCSEIASQAILGQKHSHTSYLTRGVLHPIFSCPGMHFTKPADLEFFREEALRLAEEQVQGATSLEGQFSSAFTIDLFTLIITRVLSSQRCKQFTRAFCAGPP